MLKFIALFFISGIVFVSSLNWQTDSYVLNHEQYFEEVMKETIFELERREWCNLKVDNIYQTISDSLYNFRVNGTVMYSNGFLVSVQRINVVEIEQMLTARTVDGVSTTTATVRGRLNLNDAKIGFDVEATLYNDGVVSVQRYTGIYNYGLIEYEILISKNLDTEEMSASSFLRNLAAEPGVRMIYMPANNVTEALSRRWLYGNNFDSVSRWGTADIVSIIMNVTPNRIPFPDICIGCYA